MGNLKKIKKKKKKKYGDIGTGAKFLPERELPKAQLLFERGDIAHAHGKCLEILSFSPDHADTLNFLGILKTELGEFGKADKLFQKAIKKNPLNPFYFFNYGNLFSRRKQWQQADKQYQKAISLKADFAEPYMKRLITLMKLDKADEAMVCYNQAKVFNSRNSLLYYQAGRLFIHHGNFDEARNNFQRATELNNRYGKAWYSLVRTQKYARAQNSDADRIKDVLGDQGLSLEDKAYCHFSLGKMYDDCREYSLAMENFIAGNRLIKDVLHISFDAEENEELFDRIKAKCTESYFQNIPFYGSDSKVPIFIVGMPRSGTTLVEQILASHSAIFGAGELREIQNVLNRLADKKFGDTLYPDHLDKINRKELAGAANEYLHYVQDKAKGKWQHVTDKMPYNFIFLGFIYILFPNAKIIHCRRDPLDTCLSNFFQCFGEGNVHSYNLKDIGTYYRHYRSLMEHWRQHLPAAMYEIEYEQLVSDTGHQVKLLLDFLGLEWEDSCLEFYKAKRAVITASNWQARQPIYKKSMQKWRNYEAFLGPVKDALGDL